MPIQRTEFETLADDSLDVSEGTDARQVLSVLDQHADKAFTKTELAAETGVSEADLGSVLASLEELGLVVNRSDYWAIDEHRVASLAGMRHGFAVVEDRFPPEDKQAWDEYAVDPPEESG